jgi:U4/U6.U5 tri-snRNP-associated protein 2
VYDLLANVTHESVAGTTRDKEHTIWKVHLRAAGGGGDSEKWFQIQDLIVEEIRKEMIFLGESILQVSHLNRRFFGTSCQHSSQIWERRTGAAHHEGRMDVDKH